MSRIPIRHIFKKGIASPDEMLRIAAATGDTGGVRMTLVDHAVDINATDESGWTALHWAAFCGHAETAVTLIENGANAKARDRGGYTPLDRAGAFRNELEACWRSHSQGKGNVFGETETAS